MRPAGTAQPRRAGRPGDRDAPVPIYPGSQQHGAQAPSTPWDREPRACQRLSRCLARWQHPPRTPTPRMLSHRDVGTPAPKGRTCRRFTPCGRARPGSPRYCWRRTKRRWAWESAAGSPRPSRRGPGPGPPAAGPAAAPGPPLLSTSLPLPPASAPAPASSGPPQRAGRDAHAPVACLGRALKRGHVHSCAPPRWLRQFFLGQVFQAWLAHSVGKLRPGRPAEERLCKNALVCSLRKVIPLPLSAGPRVSRSQVGVPSGTVKSACRVILLGVDL